MRFGRKPPSVLSGVPNLGRVPVDPTPGLAAAPIGDAAAAYADAAQAVDGSTVGRIFLVTNLAIAASRLGRRVLLIDGDTSPHGLSRYLSTGATPGLTELAAGTVSVTGAARMWVIDDRTKFPMIPSGEDVDNVGILSGIAVADALEAIAERADLIIIDTPPIGWSDATPHLAVHADGAILVVTDGADESATTTATERLAEVGAPVVGYIVNRTDR